MEHGVKMGTSLRFVCVALVLLAMTPSQAVGQVLRVEPALATSVVPAPDPSIESARMWPAVPASVAQSDGKRSTPGILAIHTGVGTGAGLLIGFALSGASVRDDRASVVLTWTALGAAAGLISGVVTWLVR